MFAERRPSCAMRYGSAPFRGSMVVVACDSDRDETQALLLRRVCKAGSASPKGLV